MVAEFGRGGGILTEGWGNTEARRSGRAADGTAGAKPVWGKKGDSSLGGRRGGTGGAMRWVVSRCEQRQETE